MTTDHKDAAEPVGSPVVRPVRPCGWRWLDSWIFRKSVPSYSSKYEWGPVYDKAALDAAVAAERERCAKVAEAEDVAATDDPLGVQECIAASIRRA